MNSQLGNTLAHRFHVSRISPGQTFDSGLDACPGLEVTEAVDPRGELFGLAEFDQWESCSPQATGCQPSETNPVQSGTRSIARAENSTARPTIIQDEFNGFVQILLGFLNGFALPVGARHLRASGPMPAFGGGFDVRSEGSFQSNVSSLATLHSVG